jgi:hypothetical protein
MTIPAQQAQLIEQLRWTVEDVARCFHVPLHKIASDTGVKFNNMAAMNQDYYSQCLQALIENIELLLDEGLGLAGGPQTLGTELDLEGLLRMDPVQRAQRNEVNVKAGIWSPNEARATDDMPPVPGGNEPFLQQQNFPLSVLVKQPAPGSAPAVPAPMMATEPPADPNAKSVAEVISAWQAAAAMVEAAERRRADAEALNAQVLEQIAAERKALSDESALVQAAKQLQADEPTAEDFAGLLIAKFMAASHAA